ncbi:endophilin-A3 isoform X3 [Macrotis lagotis]|uniref:endophilin-A3 isoform X3 n=1 Tax=Macrotis lagotis TaxID=92651 RepID=UPI003D68F5C8
MTLEEKFFYEKINRVERTKLDEEFLEMQRKVDITSKAIVDLLAKCTEYLQPNPAYRMKLGMKSTISKITGQMVTSAYPQPEGILGDSVLQFGKELGEDSLFGQALLDFGESMKLMAEVKDSLHINVKQNFFDPLHFLQENDLKDISYHLKKMEGRRLDYDYKKRRMARVNEEIRKAVKKFEESKEMARRDMHNLLENDIEQVSQLAVFIEAVLSYHKQSAEILLELHRKLQHRPVLHSRLLKLRSSTMIFHSNLQKTQVHSSLFILRSRALSISEDRECGKKNGDARGNIFKILWRLRSSSGSTYLTNNPCCRAIYDFVPESEGELGFKEGDIIKLTSQIDENWFEGICNGKSGFFPINYVSVLVPLRY